MSDKIEACECGRIPERRNLSYEGEASLCYRICSAKCWVGPTRDTPKEADAAWNEVMHAVRIQRGADEGIDLMRLPKGKPTAYSEGGPSR